MCVDRRGGGLQRAACYGMLPRHAGWRAGRGARSGRAKPSCGARARVLERARVCICAEAVLAAVPGSTQCLAAGWRAARGGSAGAMARNSGSHEKAKRSP